MTRDIIEPRATDCGSPRQLQANILKPLKVWLTTIIFVGLAIDANTVSLN
ncbi:hypothetical protein KCP75_02440 [Salmonella enterica subsp. enterica]|nr:hypothetical protein KCP75_02440 [Salmonella enterica subsp. enterica]